MQKVEGGSELVNRSGQTLTEIVGSVKRVTDIIAEIAAASQEQAQGIDQVNRAVSQMDQVVQGNAAQTEALSSTARALTARAAELQDLVGHFELGTKRAAAPAEAPRSASAAPAATLEPALAAPVGAAGGHGRPGRDGFEEF